MADHPIHDCIKTASELISQGHEIYQKFTCDKCGSRQTIDEPNKFYATGQCEECGHITDMRIKGCNYLAIMKRRK
jgi:transcription elongation factor Elf1